MRNRIVARLGERAAANPDVLFLTGDLGYSVVEPLQEAMGPRFVNAGVAEQNLMSMAGGLASCGLEPWCYSIAPFITIRCLEQIRNDVCYERRKVRIVGIGGGYSYGTLGPTHHSLEDATLLAALPDMVVCVPSTLAELDHLFDLVADEPRPVYWRLDRERGPARDVAPFRLDDALVRYREGADAVIIVAGSVLSGALEAADALAADGVDVAVVSVPVVAPFPVDALADVLCARPVLSVFEGFSGNPLEVGVLRAAVRAGTRAVAHADAGHAFARSVGGTDHQRARVGLDAASIAAKVRGLVEGTRGA